MKDKFSLSDTKCFIYIYIYINLVYYQFQLSVSQFYLQHRTEMALISVTVQDINLSGSDKEKNGTEETSRTIRPSAKTEEKTNWDERSGKKCEMRGKA